MTVILIDQKDSKLGRHVDHDPRSVAFQVATPKPLVDKFWADEAPILDQKSVGGCVGFTGAGILNTNLFTPVRKAKNSGKFFTDADGLKFYSAATKVDGIPGEFPGQDTGSSGLGLAKALKGLGLIDRYTHAYGWDAFVQAILQQPVALGTLWTKSMFSPDNQGVIRTGGINQSNIAGGHEWMARGLSFTRGLVLGRNHWNASWNGQTEGQKMPGEFWIPFQDVQELLANQGDVTVLHGVGMP